MVPSDQIDSEMVELRKRRIAVVGLGISNMSVISFLRANGCRVDAFDRSDEQKLGQRVQELRSMGVDLYLGPSYLDHLIGFEEIFVSPGVSLQQPRIREAIAAGARLNGEIKLFLRLCQGRVVGITGSAGKTTTTTLVGRILERSGLRYMVGGNIGVGVLHELATVNPGDLVVLELSSFQLQIVDTSPWVGAILNMYPNHLDQHSTLEEYYSAKENIIRFQGPDDYAVLSCDNPSTRPLIGKYCSRQVPFSMTENLPFGAYLDGDDLVYADEDGPQFICKTSDIRLMGRHNVGNSLAASAICRICGVGAETIRDAIRDFRGVEHRLEFVGTVEGVGFYDDSISTSPDRAIAGIMAFDRPVVLIAGGYDKNLDYDELGEVIVDRVAHLVLVGAASRKIRASVEKALAVRSSAECQEGVALRGVTQASTFAEAVEAAASEARPDGVVLLSPACASFDMFDNYKQRGDAFKQQVRRLGASSSANHSS